MLEFLLGRLRQKLNRWLCDDEEPSKVIECILPREGHRKLLVTGSVGFHLTTTPADGKQTGTRLVSAGQAVDPDHFWAVWKLFNQGKTLTWEEDGEEYDPSQGC